MPDTADLETLRVAVKLLDEYMVKARERVARVQKGTQERNAEGSKGGLSRSSHLGMAWVE